MNRHSVGGDPEGTMALALRRVCLIALGPVGFFCLSVAAFGSVPEFFANAARVTLSVLFIAFAIIAAAKKTT